MNINSKTNSEINQENIPTDFANANLALRSGDYVASIKQYVRALIETPELRDLISKNLSLAKRRYRKTRSESSRKSVAVCGWELAHNPAGRVYTLAKLYETFADVEIIGSIFPKWGREIWEPIRDTGIKKHTFVVDDESNFLRQAIELVIANPYDIVHLSKPRAPNIFFGILYKFIWGSTVLMDIDDEELAFVGEENPISIDDYIQQHDKLPDLRDLSGKDWTRIAVGLAKEFDGVTVCNSVLQAKYGGEIIRHARDEKLYQPSAELKRRNREKFGIPLDKKVVLFHGTPRKHKGLIETAQAISSLNRKDILFVVVGSFPHAELSLKKRLLEVKGVNYCFFEDQPFGEIPNVVSIADCCVILSDEISPIARYQTPAKISDALLMGLTVILNSTTSNQEFIDSGVAIGVGPTNLSNAFTKILLAKNSCSEQSNSSKLNFIRRFSFFNNSQLLRVLLNKSYIDHLNEMLINFLYSFLPKKIEGGFKLEPRIVVYTCNFGGYEAVHPPLSMDPRVEYILFTDDPRIKSDSWTVIMINHDLGDPRRASRLAKILPHKYLPEHDISIYLDSSMELVEIDIVEMAQSCMGCRDIALYKHPKRNCIYDEINFVQTTLRRVKESELAPFIQKLKTDGYPSQNGLYENGFIFRRNVPAIRELNEMWWRLYSDGPERDQFSLCYCLWKLGIQPEAIKIGQQCRINPFINFYKHDYINFTSTAKVKLYVFIAYAPKTYNMNLGRCYNDYMEMVDDEDAFIMFIDHDAILLYPGWREIAQEVIHKYVNDNALFIVRTNRINNPYQRLNLFENNHLLSDNSKYASFIAKEFGSSVTECANWPSSSGVVLMMKKSTWQKHKFSDGFLKVDNNIHIAHRVAGDKVYMMNGLYAYHFYRADNDLSHAVRAVPSKVGEVVFDLHDAKHHIRNFVLSTNSIDEINGYMQFLQPEQFAVFVADRSMFCNKDWYTQIEQAVLDNPEIGVMVFNGNDKDIDAPFGDNVLEHRSYTKSLPHSCKTLNSVHEFEAAACSRTFMVSVRLWKKYIKKINSDKFSLVDLFQAAQSNNFFSVKMNHIYVLDADIDNTLSKIKAHNRNRKVVAILTMGFWPALAGMEMMVHNLAKKLTEAGDLVVLFAPKPEIDFVEIPHSYLLIRFPDLATMKKKFRELHATMPFDILFVQGAYEPTSVALELKRELGVPILLRTHGEDIQVDDDIGYGYRLNPEKNNVIINNIREVNHNVVIGPHIIPEIKKITSRDDVTLIYNGVDVDHFSVCKTASIRQAFNLQPSTKVLLMVGRNIKKKTLHLALDALAILKLTIPDVVLVHVGKMGNGENLREYAERLGISDSFCEMGIVSYFDMPAIYNGADIFVFPSKIETFGNVTMEAMACGLPCVEFDYIVNREKIADGQTGYILPYGDVGAMARAIEVLLSNPLKCADFGVFARQRAVEVFSWWTVCEQYRQLFMSVINQAEGGGSAPRSVLSTKMQYPVSG